MTTIIEKVDATGLRVKMNNQVTVIALYTDAQGDYFYNENLEKQYVSNTPTEKKQEVKMVEVEQEDEINSYSFEVEYEHNGRVNGFALTETTVKAKSYDKALEKVKSNFKNIYEISEL